MDTYICSFCSHIKNIESHKKKDSIKLKCTNCGKKTKFFKSAEILIANPITDFVSSPTIVGDITIMEDYFRVEGINVIGNVNLKETIGSSLRGMKIMTVEDKPSIGNINIDKSSVGSINSNIVGSNINVRESKLGSLDKNIIGFTFDHDSVVLEAINYLINGGNLSSQVEDKLFETQNILNNNNQIAEELSKKLKILNETQKGALRDSIIKSLKTLGIETIKKAKSKGLDKFVAWIFISFSG